MRRRTCGFIDAGLTVPAGSQARPGCRGVQVGGTWQVSHVRGKAVRDGEHGRGGAGVKARRSGHLIDNRWGGQRPVRCPRRDPSSS